MYPVAPWRSHLLAGALADSPDHDEMRALLAMLRAIMSEAKGEYGSGR